jgi:release factor glutamine methyltransferase
VSETWTILKVLNWTAQRFGERGLSSPRLEAEVLLAHALRTNRIGLYTGYDKPLVDEELAAYRDLVKRRLGGEPVAYLVGTQEFWSLSLAVDPRVLIPRRDTETLVEVGLRHARTGAGIRRFADVCTGSGAVAIALGTELPSVTAVATDLSTDALAVARANVETHKLGDRIELRAGDLCAPLDGTFDLILSNPPYVRSGEIAGLAPEVRREPRGALDGGPDGLILVRRLVAEAAEKLEPGGMLALEHGFDQAAEIARIFTAAGYAKVVTTKDLGGLDRVTGGLRPPPRS